MRQYIYVFATIMLVLSMGLYAYQKDYFLPVVIVISLIWLMIVPFIIQAECFIKGVTPDYVIRKWFHLI
jgi:hypothetical protein